MGRSSSFLSRRRLRKSNSASCRFRQTWRGVRSGCPGSSHVRLRHSSYGRVASRSSNWCSRMVGFAWHRSVTIGWYRWVRSARRILPRIACQSPRLPSCAACSRHLGPSHSRRAPDVSRGLFCWLHRSCASGAWACVSRRCCHEWVVCRALAVIESDGLRGPRECPSVATRCASRAPTLSTWRATSSATPSVDCGWCKPTPRSERTPSADGESAHKYRLLRDSGLSISGLRRRSLERLCAPRRALGARHVPPPFPPAGEGSASEGDGRRPYAASSNARGEVNVVPLSGRPR